MGFFMGDEPINIPGTCVCPLFLGLQPSNKKAQNRIKTGGHLGSRYVYTLYGVVYIYI